MLLLRPAYLISPLAKSKLLLTVCQSLSVQGILLTSKGVLRTMIVINGQFPSPMIRANRGDRLLINVTNALTYPTSIHWHGLYQNGTNWMDGTAGITQCPIPPDRS